MRKESRPFGFAGWRWDLLGHVRGEALEIGCGWGHNFNHYADPARVTAFDLELGRVRAAARRHPAVSLAAADAQQLSFPDRSFDSVVGTLVFCSVRDPALALAEIRRVLKPDGRLLLIDHVRSRGRWLGRAQDALAPAWLALTGGCNLNRDPEPAVRDAGFEIEALKVGFAGLLKLLVARPAA